MCVLASTAIAFILPSPWRPREYAYPVTRAVGAREHA